jgi:gliding motility-associated-like protein
MKALIVSILILLTFNLRSQQVIELCDVNQKTFTYSSSSNIAGSWIWVMGGDTVSNSNSVTITWADTGYFKLEVYFESGCQSNPRILDVQVINCAESAIFFPNSFTPNGDGVNDIWGPKGLNIAQINWTIWNRWGESIFESTEINTAYETWCCWDGTHQSSGYPVQDGVYIYKARWQAVGGKWGERIGVIVLINN